jgi:hypothetical protein
VRRTVKPKTHPVSCHFEKCQKTQYEILTPEPPLPTVRASSPAVPEIDRVVPREKVGQVLPTADVVMVAMPPDSATRGFLSAERIALMKTRRFS